VDTGQLQLRLSQHLQLVSTTALFTDTKIIKWHSAYSRHANFSK